MDKNPFITKGLSLGIILLFVGITVNPITGISSNRDDTTPPMTTISFNPPVPDGMNGWYVSPVTVTLNATDNESGVWRTFCNLSPGGNYTEPILVSQDGIYEITFYSIDYAGNVEATKSVWIKIDKTPPKVIMDWDWEQVGSVINIIVTATCTDAMSATMNVEFYFNDELVETVTGAGPRTYVWTFQFTPLLSFTIKAVAS